MKFKEMEMKYDLTLWGAGIVVWLGIMFAAFWSVGAFAHTDGEPGHMHLGQVEQGTTSESVSPTVGNSSFDTEPQFVVPPEGAEGLQDDVTEQHKEELRQHKFQHCAHYQSRGLCIDDPEVKCDWIDNACAYVGE